MLRGLLLLVLAANGLFLAWSQGWLAPTAPGPRAAAAEPQRLANQVRPEWVQALPPSLPQAKAASAVTGAGAAVTPATPDGAWACLEAGPFGAAEASAAEARLTAAAIPEEDWSRETLTATSSVEAAVNQVWLRVPRASAELQAKLLALSAADLAGGFRPCR